MEYLDKIASCLAEDERFEVDDCVSVTVATGGNRDIDGVTSPLQLDACRSMISLGNDSAHNGQVTLVKDDGDTDGTADGVAAESVDEWMISITTSDECDCVRCRGVINRSGVEETPGPV